MNIERVNQPEWLIKITEKDRQALEIIFGNLADMHLKEILGNSNLSDFVLEFYRTIAYIK